MRTRAKKEATLSGTCFTLLQGHPFERQREPPCQQKSDKRRHEYCICIMVASPCVCRNVNLPLAQNHPQRHPQCQCRLLTSFPSSSCGYGVWGGGRGGCHLARFAPTYLDVEKPELEECRSDSAVPRVHLSDTCALAGTAKNVLQFPGLRCSHWARWPQDSRPCIRSSSTANEKYQSTKSLYAFPQMCSGSVSCMARFLSHPESELATAQAHERGEGARPVRTTTRARD